jgi:hypothetical protein
MDIYKIIEEEFNKSSYLKWKRDHVTYRGIKDVNNINGGSSYLGKGLYTAFLSNKGMAKQYGRLHFVVGAKPKKPKVFNNTNEWEIWFYNNLVMEYSRNEGKTFPDIRDFNKNTTIEEMMQKLGFDGIIIKGREMVNYTPDEKNIKYFDNEDKLIRYYQNVILGQY